MVVQDPGLIPNNSITCQFVNADIPEETETNSVKYEVVGEDRDWVFLTSSQLHERIEKVKIFAPAQRFRKRAAFIPIMTLLLLLGTFGQLFVIDKSVKSNGVTEFDSMEVAHRTGTLNDPVEAVIQVGRLLDKNQHRNASVWKDMWPLLAVIALPMLLLIAGYSYVYFAAHLQLLMGRLCVFLRKAQGPISSHTWWRSTGDHYRRCGQLHLKTFRSIRATGGF